MMRLLALASVGLFVLGISACASHDDGTAGDEGNASSYQEADPIHQASVVLGISTTEARSLADAVLAAAGVSVSDASYEGIFSAALRTSESSGVPAVDLLECAGEGPTPGVAEAIAACAVLLE